MHYRPARKSVIVTMHVTITVVSVINTSRHRRRHHHGFSHHFALAHYRFVVTLSAWSVVVVITVTVIVITSRWDTVGGEST
ncbi:hypothetical protein NPIL_495481 [Nephila pilipes]|uniref:Uncharacterized protein n=1 Tax=Nephila pilipes TaxID=299642 RepID=A0A8X6UDM1_NEPPI|nr:hypothetical protein NPIL_495481 [Nephila pilipes]